VLHGVMVQVACAAPANPESFSLCGLGSSPPQKISKNGKNAFLLRVASVARQTTDKLDEACTNADDRMMLVKHCSGDRVMS